jgi:hypothetical protein
MSCEHVRHHRDECPFTYPCERKGKCCECLEYHRPAGELPACYFPPAVERTYDRTIARFVTLHRAGQEG